MKCVASQSCLLWPMMLGWPRSLSAEGPAAALHTGALRDSNRRASAFRVVHQSRRHGPAMGKAVVPAKSVAIPLTGGRQSGKMAA
jgi:hypothetical protein